MKGKDKTRQQLIDELERTRQRMAELQALEIEHQRVERALQESEAKLKSVLSSMNDLVFTLDRNGIFLDYYQPANASELYAPPEVFLGRSFKDVLPPDATGLLEDAIDAVVSANEVQQLDYPMAIAGKEKWFSAKVSMRRDNDGEFAGVTIVSRDITERKRAEEALRESEERFQALLEYAPVGIVIVDSDGRIVLTNAKTEEMFAYERSGLLGESHEILLPERLRNIHAEQRAEYMSAPRQRKMGVGLELVARHKDGTEFPVEIGLSFIDTRDGILVISSVVDITERVRMEETLREHTAELEVRNEELGAFAHTVAHDLKTPLALTIGYSGILAEDYATIPPEDVHRYLRLIAQNGRRMSNIIDELLLLAGLREMEAEMQPLDMASIISEVQDRLAYMIEEHQPEIVMPDIWPAALGYGPWIEEVWANYLSNALKYGGRPPRVELGGMRLADGTVRFWVRDNGPGLTPEARARLFTPFTRLDQAHPEGHGLGLSIVRRIVEKLDGQVGVESQADQGSTFYFVLPGADTQPWNWEEFIGPSQSSDETGF